MEGRNKVGRISGLLLCGSLQHRSVAYNSHGVNGGKDGFVCVECVCSEESTHLTYSCSSMAKIIIIIVFGPY